MAELLAYASLVRDGVPIHVLEEGDCFGYPSIINRAAPAFDVVARGDVRVHAVPAALFRQLLQNAGFAEFFLESYDIDAVIVLELSDEEVQRRVLSRRLCTGCGLDYNLIAHRPKQPDVCDVCGGSLVPRGDDTRDALARRLADYYAKTEPVIDVFARKELVVRIDATPSRSEVFAAIVDRLGLAGSESVSGRPR